MKVVGAADEGGDEDVRLAVCVATKSVLARSLDLLGVAAPGVDVARAGEALGVSPARVAITVVFALNGFLFGSIFSRLPAIQERTGIGDGELGLALLCSMLGLLCAQVLGGALVARFGSRPLVRTGALGVRGSADPDLARRIARRCSRAASSLVGLANGVLDVSMNVHGLAVERKLGRPILATLHAGFSFGALAGAGAGGLVAAAGVGVEPHLAAASAVGVVVALTTYRFLLPREVDAAPEGPLVAKPTRALAAVGLFAFCVVLSEGAVNDWAAVYLKGDLGAGEGLAAAGLAAFSLTMGFGRLVRRPARGAAGTGAAGPRRGGAGGRGHDRRRGGRPAGNRDRGLRGHGGGPGRALPAGHPRRRRARRDTPGPRWPPCRPWATSAS